MFLGLLQMRPSSEVPVITGGGCMPTNSITINLTGLIWGICP